MTRLPAMLVVFAFLAAACALGPASAFADASANLTLKELKDSGGQAMTSGQVKTFLLKGTVHWTNKEKRDTLKFFDDGTLKATNQRNFQARGTWSVDAEGIFSMVQNWSTQEKTSGKAYAKGDACYLFSPDASDGSTWVYFME
ncbi:MAG: hypothetical protein KKA55_08565 [Proteobacteria bacterium]|nr:hypothetical protein [Pseudomonadota bacterium]MBU1595569.1 hypothetical protein [Pseudomonadota bacterium]